METDQRQAPRLVFCAAVAIMLFAVVPLALADRGGTRNGGGDKNSGSSTSTGTSGALTLSSNTVKLNPTLPSWCLSEDDYDQRVFTGSLSGSSSTSYQTCGLNTDGFTAGGTWHMTLSGQLSNVTWTTRAQMTDVVFQQNYCPTTQQNLSP